MPQAGFMPIAVLGNWVLLRGADGGVQGVEIGTAGPIRTLLPDFFTQSTRYHLLVCGDAILVDRRHRYVDVYRPVHSDKLIL